MKSKSILADIRIGLFYLPSVYGTIPVCGHQLTYSKKAFHYVLAEPDGKFIRRFETPEAVAKYLAARVPE